MILDWAINIYSNKVGFVFGWELFFLWFVMILFILRREEKPTRCHWMVYYTYNMLNMFRALLCPSSGARDYMCVITAYGVQWLCCWLSEVRCRTAGYVSRMRNVGRIVQHPSSWTHSLLPAPDLRQPTTNPLHTIGGNNTHIVWSSGLWAQKCPKHVEHIISAINHSVASSWFFFSTHMQRTHVKFTFHIVYF